MKILIFLFCATIMMAQDVQTPVTPIVDGEKVLLIKGRIAGDMKNWLRIEVHNGRDWPKDGYDPTYTRIVCDYLPLFRKIKLPNGDSAWEIMFTSEIAKDLP